MSLYKEHNKLFGSLSLYILAFTLVPMAMTFFVKDKNIILSMTVLVAFLIMFLIIGKDKFIHNLIENKKHPTSSYFWHSFSPPRVTTSSAVFFPVN